MSKTQNPNEQADLSTPNAQEFLTSATSKSGKPTILVNYPALLKASGDDKALAYSRLKNTDSVNFDFGILDHELGNDPTAAFDALASQNAILAGYKSEDEKKQKAAARAKFAENLAKSTDSNADYLTQKKAQAAVYDYIGTQGFNEDESEAREKYHNEIAMPFYKEEFARAKSGFGFAPLAPLASEADKQENLKQSQEHTDWTNYLHEKVDEVSYKSQQIDEQLKEYKNKEWGTFTAPLSKGKEIVLGTLLSNDEIFKSERENKLNTDFNNYLYKMFENGKDFDSLSPLQKSRLAYQRRLANYERGTSLSPYTMNMQDKRLSNYTEFLLPDSKDSERLAREEFEIRKKAHELLTSKKQFSELNKNEQEFIKDKIGFWDMESGRIFNKEHYNKEFQHQKKLYEANTIIVPELLAAFAAEDTLAQDKNLLRNLISNRDDPIMQKALERTIRNKTKIARAFGFDGVKLVQNENGDVETHIIAPDGREFLVNEDMGTNFLNSMKAMKGEIALGIYGATQGFKKGKNPLGKAVNSALYAAGYSMGGAGFDYLLGSIVADREVNFGEYVDKLLETGTLSLLTDAGVMAGGALIKGIANGTINSKIVGNAAKSAGKKITSSADFLTEHTPIIGWIWKFGKNAATDNIKGAESIIAANKELSDLINETYESYGGRVAADDKTFLQGVADKAKAKFGENSKEANLAQGLFEAINHNSIKDRQRAMLEYIRADESGRSLGILAEVANKSPQVQANLRVILNATSADLKNKLKNLGVNNMDIKKIFDDFESAVGRDYDEAMDEVLAKIYPKDLEIYRAEVDKTEFNDLLAAFADEKKLISDESKIFKQEIVDALFNSGKLSFSELNNIRKILNEHTRKLLNKQPSFSNTLSLQAQAKLRTAIDNAIKEIFSQNKTAFAKASELYNTALKEYGEMKELLKIIDELNVRAAGMNEAQAVERIVQYAMGQGEEGLANLAKLTRHLTPENRAVVEMNMLQNVFEKCLYKDEAINLEVFDPTLFFKRLKELTGENGEKAVFESKQAKEFIKMAEDFNVLFKKDAEIARKLHPAKPEKAIGEESNFATTGEQKFAMLKIKLLFGWLARNCPDFFFLPESWKTRLSNAALRYHLEKALLRSGTIDEFKKNFSEGIKRSAHSSKVNQIIKEFNAKFDEVEDIAKMSDDEVARAFNLDENGNPRNNPPDDDGNGSGFGGGSAPNAPSGNGGNSGGGSLLERARAANAEKRAAQQAEQKKWDDFDDEVNNAWKDYFDSTKANRTASETAQNAAENASETATARSADDLAENSQKFTQNEPQNTAQDDILRELDELDKNNPFERAMREKRAEQNSQVTPPNVKVVSETTAQNAPSTPAATQNAPTSTANATNKAVYDNNMRILKENLQAADEGIAAAETTAEKNEWKRYKATQEQAIKDLQAANPEHAAAEQKIADDLAQKESAKDTADSEAWHNKQKDIKKKAYEMRQASGGKTTEQMMADNLEIGEPIPTKSLDREAIVTDNRRVGKPPVNVEYIVVKKDDLKTEFNGGVGLQPRTGKKTQTIEAAIKDFDPNKMFGFDGGFEGHPIIIRDGQVLAGNHRTEIVQRLDANPEQWEKYKAAVKKHFKIDLADDEMVVRIIKDDLSNEDLIELANLSNRDWASNTAENMASQSALYKKPIQKLDESGEVIMNIGNTPDECMGAVARTLNLNPELAGRGADNVEKRNMNEALLKSEMRVSTNGTTPEMAIQNIDTLKPEMAQKVKDLFVKNAGALFNISRRPFSVTKDGEPICFNLQEFLTDIVVSVTQKAENGLNGNWAERLGKLQKRVKEQIQKGTNINAIDKSAFHNVMVDIFGEGIAKFLTRTDPATSFFEFAKDTNAKILDNINEGGGIFVTLAQRDLTKEPIDEFDFLKVVLNFDNSNRTNTKAELILEEIAQDLDKLREIQKALKEKDGVPLNNKTHELLIGKDGGVKWNGTAAKMDLSNPQSARDLKEFYAQNSTSKTDDELFNRTLEAAQHLGVNVKFSDSAERSFYDPATNMVTIARKNSGAVQAEDLCHELIHAATEKGLRLYKTEPAIARQIFTDKQMQAFRDIDELYAASRRSYQEMSEAEFKAHLKDLQEKGYLPRDFDINTATKESFSEIWYGYNSVYEFVGELANPIFRETLKKQGIWETIKNCLVNFFWGGKPSSYTTFKTTSYEALKKRYYTILDEYKKPPTKTDIPLKINISEPTLFDSDLRLFAKARTSSDTPQMNLFGGSGKQVYDESSSLFSLDDIIGAAKIKKEIENAPVKQFEKPILNEQQQQAAINSLFDDGELTAQPATSRTASETATNAQNLGETAENLAENSQKGVNFNENSQKANESQEAKEKEVALAKAANTDGIDKMTLAELEAEEERLIKEVYDVFGRQHETIANQLDAELEIAAQRYPADFITNTYSSGSGYKKYAATGEGRRELVEFIARRHPDDPNLQNALKLKHKLSVALKEAQEILAAPRFEAIYQRELEFKNLSENSAAQTQKNLIDEPQGQKATQTPPQNFKEFYQTLSDEIKALGEKKDFEIAYNFLNNFNFSKYNKGEYDANNSKLIKQINKLLDRKPSFSLGSVKYNEFYNFDNYIHAINNPYVIDSYLLWSKYGNDDTLKRAGFFAKEGSEIREKFKKEKLKMSPIFDEIAGIDQRLIEHIKIQNLSEAIYTDKDLQIHLYAIDDERLAKMRNAVEQAANITPIKEFGTNYAEFYRDGTGAVRKLLAEADEAAKNGAEFNGQVAGAFYRDELGDIDLVWGNDSKGLKRILTTKDGEQIADIIERGEVQINGTRGTITSERGSLAVEKQGEKWILDSADGINSGGTTSPTTLHETPATSRAASETATNAQNLGENLSDLSENSAAQTQKNLIDEPQGQKAAAQSIVERE